MKCIFNGRNLVLAVALAILIGIFMKGDMPYDGSIIPEERIADFGEDEQQIPEDMNGENFEEEGVVKEPEVLLVMYDEEKLSGMKKVTITDAGASSHLVSNSGLAYSVDFSYDGDLSTSWQDGEYGYGEGSSLYYQFIEPSKVRYICIFSGSGESVDKFHQNGRLKEVTLTLDGVGYNLILGDNPAYQMIRVDGDLTCDSAALTINGVYEGSKYEDTCVAEIAFYTE